MKGASRREFRGSKEEVLRRIEKVQESIVEASREQSETGRACKKEPVLAPRTWTLIKPLESSEQALLSKTKYRYFRDLQLNILTSLFTIHSHTMLGRADVQKHTLETFSDA